MHPAVFPTNLHAGWPQGFALPCADESALLTIYFCLAIITDFLHCFTYYLACLRALTTTWIRPFLLQSDTPTALSGMASQPNSSSSFQHTFLPTSSSVLSSAQLLAHFFVTVVQAVKATYAAEQAPVVHSNIMAFSSEDNVQRSESSALAHTYALGPHVISFGCWIKSSIALFPTLSIFLAT